MPVAELTAAFTAFRAAKDSIALLYAAKADADKQEARFQAMDQLGKAQDSLYRLREELAQLQEDNSNLKRDLDAAEAWKTKLESLDLVQTAGGAVVYQHKQEPRYFACPVCVNDKKVVPLQDNRKLDGSFRCVACSANYPIKPHAPPEPLPHPRSYTFPR